MAVRLLLLLLLLLPASASATFMTFSDRAAWEAALLGAGLHSVTEDFSSDPGTAFSIYGVDFELLGSSYNAGSQDLTPGPGGLTIDLLGGTPVYGLGIDFNAGFGLVSGFPSMTVSDGTQTASKGGALGSLTTLFVGILSTQPLDPACSFCGDPEEIELAVQFGNALMFADDLSVAVVPEPGTLVLMTLGLGGLALAGRRS